MRRNLQPIIYCLLLLFIAPGCKKSFVRNINKISAKASVAIEEYDNPVLLGRALPNNLLMSEGYFGIAPDNVPLLVSTAKSYGLYAMGFVEDNDQEHAKQLYARGKTLGLRALKQNPEFNAALGDGSLEKYKEALAVLQLEDIGPLFVTVNNWLSWINLNAGDPEAMMDMPKVEAMMNRILALKEDHYYGGIHAALGTYYGSMSKAIGGNPEQAKQHFEKAFAISNKEYLYFHVLYARTYLVQIQDKDGFTKTLKQVLQTPSNINRRMTMANEIAKMKAEMLLEKVDEYFL